MERWLIVSYCRSGGQFVFLLGFLLTTSWIWDYISAEAHECNGSTQLQCNNGACANQSSTCIYGLDEYGLHNGCLDVTHFFAVLRDISNNGITDIGPFIFNESVNMLNLSLASNLITHLRANTFIGLRRLVFLNLVGNPLQIIDPGTFNGFTSLPELKLIGFPAKVLPDGALDGLDSLKILSLSDCSQMNIMPRTLSTLGNLLELNIINTAFTAVNEDTFDGLHLLRSLYSDRYLFCCLVGEIETCTPPADQFSSCEDLMRNSVLRSCIWLLGISALLGNFLVLVWRLRNGTNERSKVQSCLILNLALSDFLMGVYMVIIGSADLQYRNVYILHAEEWGESFLCKAAGLLSVVSSEVSVVMLVTISLDRFWCVVFPLKRARLGVKSSRVVASVVWSTMIIVSVIPVLGLPYFAGSFYGRTGVCLALPLTQDHSPGWEYSVSFFLIFNMICFIIILVCYTGIYITVKRTSRKVRSNRKTQEVKMAGRAT